MKAFEFSLSKIYRYKDQVLNTEKQSLSQLQQQVRQIEQQLSDLEIYRMNINAEMQAKQKTGTSGIELNSFKYMLENTKYQIDDLNLQKIKLAELIELQMQVVIQASQEVSGLEKLEEKQREQYEKEQLKAEELQMLEHITTAITKKAKESDDE